MTRANETITDLVTRCATEIVGGWLAAGAHLHDVGGWVAVPTADDLDWAWCQGLDGDFEPDLVDAISDTLAALRTAYPAKITWSIAEDNAGGITLYVWRAGVLAYVCDGFEQAVSELLAAVSDLRRGSDVGGWDGNIIWPTSAASLLADLAGQTVIWTDQGPTDAPAGVAGREVRLSLTSALAPVVTRSEWV